MELLIRYTRAALVVGIILLGFAVHNLWLAIGGHAYVAREQLTPLQVYVNSAAHVTEKGKRGVTRREYYELKASLRERVGQKVLRMDIGLPEELIASLIEEKVNLLVDEDNHLLVYEASVLDDTDGQQYELLSYDDMRNLLQEKAENSAKNPVWGGLGLLLTAAGVFGLRQKRKQRRAAEAEEKAENPA